MFESPFLLKLLWTAVQGSFLLGLVWFISSRLLFEKPKMRTVLWGIAFAHFLIALFVAVPVPILPENAHEGLARVSVKGGAEPEARKPIAHTLTSASPAVSGTSIVIGLWVFGALANLSLLLVRETRFRAKLKHGATQNRALEAATARVADRLGLRKIPELYVTRHIKTPCVSGILNPTIFWPVELSREMDEKLTEAILVHEMTHVKNGDIAVGWLAALARCPYFFNPLLWLAVREFNAQNEVLCDRKALLISQIGRQAYCSLLIDLATHRPMMSATTHAATKDFTHLHRRINHMKLKTQKAKGAASIAVIAALCLATLAAVPMMATTHKSHDIKKSITSKKLDDATLPKDALLPKEAVIPGDALQSDDIPMADIKKVGTVPVVQMGQVGTVEIVDEDGSIHEEPVYNAVGVQEEPVYGVSEDVMATPVSFNEASKVSAKAVLNSIAEQAKVKIDSDSVKDATIDNIVLDGARFEQALRVLARALNAKWTRVSDREFKLE